MRLLYGHIVDQIGVSVVYGRGSRPDIIRAVRGLIDEIPAGIREGTGGFHIERRLAHGTLLG